MKDILNSRLISTIIIVVVLIILAQWGYNKYTNLKTELKISEQNSKAFQDSLRITRNDLGQLEVSKKILVAKNEKDLKELNEKLYNIVSKLDGKISSLTSTVIHLQGIIEDMENIPTDITDVSPPDISGTAIKSFDWEYEKRFDEDNYRALAGKTTFSINFGDSIIKALKTTITKDIINFQITQGLRTTKDGVEMFATSNYPNFEIKELNSVLIDPDTHPALKQFSKQKKFSFGAYTGVGGTINLNDYSMIFGPQFGIGINWMLW